MANMAAIDDIEESAYMLIIIHDLASYFCFILIPMLWIYDH